MNGSDHDCDEFLRRALHEAADWLEPSEDGLERIRARLTRPRSTPVAWMMAAFGRRVPPRAPRRGRSRRWRCAAALLSTAVVAAAAGALALTPLPRQAVARTGALIRSFDSSGSAGGAGGQRVTGSGTRSAPRTGGATGAAPHITHHHKHTAPAKGAGSAPSPVPSRVACGGPSASPSPDPSPSRAACPSPSPGASPSPSLSASPSPSSSPSPSPSPSPSASSSPSPDPGASLGGAAP
jgi:hypothetical protein